MDIVFAPRRTSGDPVFSAQYYEPSSVGAYAITTDGASFSGGARASPLASFSITTSDAVFSGGARVSQFTEAQLQEILAYVQQNLNFRLKAWNGSAWV